MRSRLVIFDCGGILIDSQPLSCIATSAELHDAGFPLSAEAIGERFTGMSDASMLATIEREAERPLPPDMAERIHDRLMAMFRQDPQAVDHVAEVLDHLDASGFTCCMASSSTPERLKVTHDKPVPDFFSSGGCRDGRRAGCLRRHRRQRPGCHSGPYRRHDLLGFCGASHCPVGHGDALIAAGAKTTFDTMRQLPDLLTKLP